MKTSLTIAVLLLASLTITKAVPWPTGTPVPFVPPGSTAADIATTEKPDATTTEIPPPASTAKPVIPTTTEVTPPASTAKPVIPTTTEIPPPPASTAKPVIPTTTEITPPPASTTAGSTIPVIIVTSSTPVEPITALTDDFTFPTQPADITTQIVIETTTGNDVIVTTANSGGGTSPATEEPSSPATEEPSSPDTEEPFTPSTEGPVKPSTAKPEVPGTTPQPAVGGIGGGWVAFLVIAAIALVAGLGFIGYKKWEERKAADEERQHIIDGSGSA